MLPMSEELGIRKCVRQGFVLYPLLFNLYSDVIFREALEDKPEGIVVNCVVKKLRYIDDTVFLATNLDF